MSDMHPDQFSAEYKLDFIMAYPVIADMTGDQLYSATAAEKDEAFQRILDNHHLRRTHEQYLKGPPEWAK